MRRLFIIIILITPFYLFANNELDSLFSNIDNLSSKEKLQKYLSIQEHYLENSDSLIVNCYNKIIPLTQKLHDDNSFFKAKEILAKYYFHIFFYNKAIEFITPVIEFKRLNKTNAFDDYFILIISYYNNGNYPEVFNCYEIIKEIQFKVNREKLGIIENVVGTINLKYDNYKEAKKHFYKSIKIFEKLKNKRKLVESYDNISKLFALENNFKDAILYTKKSLKIYKNLGNSTPIGQSDLNLAEFYLNLKNFKLAKKYLEEASVIIKKSNYSADLSCLYQKFACFYFQKKNYNKSETYVFKSLKILKHLVWNDILIKDYLVLTRIKIYKNQPSKADSLMTKLFNIIETDNKTKINLKVKEKSKKLSFLKRKKEFKIVQKKIEMGKLKLKRNRIFVIFVIIFLIFLIYIIIISLKRTKYSKKLLSELDEKTVILQKEEELQEKLSEEKINLEKENSYYETVLKTNQEFNQPLMVIHGNIELIKNFHSSKLDKKIIKKLDKIEESCLRINKILNNMKNLENIETEKYINTHNENMISLKRK